MSVIETFAQTIDRLYEDLDDDAVTNTPYQGEAGMTTPGSCCDGSCPEIADVTIEEVSIYINGVTIEWVITFTPPNPDPVKTGANIAIQLKDSDGVDVAQRMQIMLHWCDNNYDYGVISAAPPATPGWQQKTVYTDEAGAFELDVENLSPDRIWYLIATSGAIVEAIGPVGLGAP